MPFPVCPACGSDLDRQLMTAPNRLFLNCTACEHGVDLRHPERNRCDKPKCGSEWVVRENKKRETWFLGCKNHFRTGCPGNRNLDLAPAREELALQPTNEQSAIVDCLLTGDPMVIRALAGTGKTSTLRMLTDKNRDIRFQYVVFNKAVQVDAEQKFGGNVNVNTAHSLAYQGVRMTRGRVDSWPSNSDLGISLGCKPFSETIKGETIDFTSAQVAEYARSTVAEFAKSLDRQINEDHVRFRTGRLQHSRRPPAEWQAAVGGHVLPYARKLWSSYCDPDGMGYSDVHDIYLKRWHLTDPTIDADVILFDEAQDADPVMTSIMMNQEHAQLVYCGDSFQSIYEWRGAVDALDNFASGQKENGSNADEFWLTQSFRFGPAIANEAQRLLALLDCPHALRGSDEVKSVVGADASPSCIICRTNKAALEAISDAVDAGRKPHLLGRNYVTRMQRLVQASIRMQNGDSFDHQILNVFRNWTDAVAWASQPDQELDPDASQIQTIDVMGANRVSLLLNQHVNDEEQADVIVTTVHQAKGLEWDSVQLANDFKNPEDSVPIATSSQSEKRRMREELRIAYVAVTRAKSHLDLGQGLWNAPRRVAQVPPASQ